MDEDKKLARDRYNELRRLRRAKMKAFALDYLGGVCVMCGTDEKLEFDHVDMQRDDPEHCISVMISNLSNNARSYDLIIEELKKCQLLCSPCHFERTRLQFNYRQYIHGTTTCYRKMPCRCEKCRTAHIEYLRSYRLKHKQKVE